MGGGSACNFLALNTSTLLLDRVSQNLFELPGRCVSKTPIISGVVRSFVKHRQAN
jgi:hypothetical protein